MIRLIALLAFAPLLNASPLVEHRVRIECGFVFGRGRVSSMGDYLRDGDLVRVMPVAMECVRVRQTVEVEFLGARVPSYCHEVIAVRRAANGGLYFITKGTANPEADARHVTALEYRGVLDIPLIQHKL